MKEKLSERIGEWVAAIGSRASVSRSVLSEWADGARALEDEIERHTCSGCRHLLREHAEDRDGYGYCNAGCPCEIFAPALGEPEVVIR